MTSPHGAEKPQTRQSRASDSSRNCSRLVACLMLAAIVVFGPAGCGGGDDKPEPVAQPTATPVKTAAKTTEVRPVYPLSVVPGGAKSPAELREHARKDPVVRKSFDEMGKRLGDPKLLEHVRVEKVPQTRKAHTQLREGNKLYWSKGQVTLRKGETVFVHEQTGKLVARTRCANTLVEKLPPGAVTRPAPPDKPVAQKRVQKPKTPKVALKKDTPPVDEGTDDTAVTITEVPQTVAPEAPLGEMSPPEVPELPTPIEVPVTTVATWDVTFVPTAFGGATPTRVFAAPSPPSVTWATPDVPSVVGHAASWVVPGSTGYSWLPWLIGGGVIVPIVEDSADDEKEDLPPATPECSTWVLLAVSGGAVAWRYRCVRRRGARRQATPTR